MAGTRALARTAWRDIKRNKWRSALVVAMVGLPIMGLTAGGALVAAAAPTYEELVTDEMGAADVVIYSWAEEQRAEEVAASLPASTWTALHRWDVSTIVGGEYHYIATEDADPFDPVLGPIYDLRSGRAATAPGEVAVAPVVLERLGAEVGDTIPMGDDATPFLVVGEVVKRESLRYPLALVAPGTLEGNPQAFFSGLFVDFAPGTPQQVIDEALADEAIYAFGERRWYSAGEPTGTTQSLLIPFALAAIVLLETGLVAAAAFVVSAQRKLRTIGILGASGAEPGQIRRLVLMDGVLLGLTGSAVGVVLGLAIAFAVSPNLDSLAGRMTGPFAVPILLPIGAIVLGTLASTIAAYGPARSAAKVSTVQALAGRTRAPRPAGALARWGALAILIGAVITAWGAVEVSDVWLVSGPVITVLGFLVVIPFLVTLLGRVAGSLPLPARVAARDTARHGRRTGAAVAAATVALIVPVAVATATLSADAWQRSQPSLPPDQLVVNVPALAAESDDGAMERFVERIETEVLPGATTATALLATYGDSYDLRDDFMVSELLAYAYGEERHLGDGVVEIPGEVVSIGDADLLRALGGEEHIAALEAGMAIVPIDNVVDNGVMHLEDPSADPEQGPTTIDIPAIDAGTGVYGAGLVPGLIISEGRAEELGLVAVPGQQVVIRAAADITDEQLAAVRELAAEVPGMVVMSRADLVFDAAPLRWIVLAFTALSALGIIAVAVALVSAESRRSGAILAAVGADPRAQRTIAGNRALQLTLLAAVLAVPAGFLPITVIQLASQEGYPVVVPWAAIAVVLVALPVLAGAVAAGVSRRPASDQMLRPVM